MGSEKITRGKRPSDDQKMFLIEYLEGHEDLAHDRLECLGGAHNRDLLWKSLAIKLNALGGTHKDGPKWRKYWMDQKLHSKERNAQVQDSILGRFVYESKKIKPLTEPEIRILRLINQQTGDRNVFMEEQEFSEAEILQESNESLQSATQDSPQIIEEEDFIEHEVEISHVDLDLQSKKRPHSLCNKTNFEQMFDLETEKMEIKRRKLAIEEEKLSLEREKN